MSEEKKLLKILEQFRDQLSDKEVAFIDNLTREGESIEESLDIQIQTLIFLLMVQLNLMKI
ncbi:MAG: hypothetical protein Ct9H90mP15_02930 [Candidatus Neomarinimicrobiota bacterium]|nr:MAG: hypothetical protein Ct9H90mP15_02930 [Candidatus Neomarinimicrobiota bacterium]